jgi:hypothetical protein
MKGVEVHIFTFSGSRFNRVLTSLLQDRLGGKAHVHYNDFVVKVMHAGKERVGQRVINALQEIQIMGKDEIGAILPMPSVEGWKFARALPPSLFADMVLSDHYHVEDFMDLITSVPVTLHSEPVRHVAPDES